MTVNRPNFSAACCAFALALMLSACAGGQKTVAEDESATPYQTVTVNTPGEEAVSCVLQSGHDTYTVQAPGSVTVRRSPAQMTVNCFKGAHMRGTKSVSPTFAPREAQMVMADHASCYTCNYPGTITVPMGIDPGSLEVDIHQWP